MPVRYQKGFTFIEIMVVVAILGILASIALPNYQRYITQTRRVDGQEMLAKLQLAQEKWRTDHMAYTSTLSDLGISSSSSGGYYTIAITAADGSSFAATATATGNQTNDTGCTTLTLSQANNQITTSPSDCWKK